MVDQSKPPPDPAPVRELDANDLNGWLSSNPFCLVEFYGSWCIYHLLTKRKNDQLSEQFRSNIAFGRFDVVGHEDLVRKLEIEFVPTIALFRDGRLELMWAGDTDLDLMIAGIQELLQPTDDDS